MEILILKSFMVNGRPAPAGAIVDLPVADAQYAIGLKRAERIEPSASADTPPAPPVRRVRKVRVD